MEDLIPLPSYAPDGLSEAEIDAMIAEYFVTTDEQAESRIGSVKALNRVAEHRHTRRISRQAVSSVLRARPESPTSSSEDAGAAA